MTLRRDAKPVTHRMGTGLPFIFQIVLLLLLPLALVYLVSVVALSIDLLQSAFGQFRLRDQVAEKTVGDDSKPYIRNFSQ